MRHDPTCECGAARDAAGRCPTCDVALAAPGARARAVAARQRARERAAGAGLVGLGVERVRAAERRALGAASSTWRSDAVQFFRKS